MTTPSSQFDLVTVTTSPSAAAPTPQPTTRSPSTIFGTSLGAWLDAGSISAASGAEVSSWADASGNSLTAQQSTAARRPTLLTNAIGGKPAVRFDGVDDYLDITSNPHTHAPEPTIFVVMKFLNTKTGWQNVAGIAHDTTVHTTPFARVGLSALFDTNTTGRWDLRRAETVLADSISDKQSPYILAFHSRNLDLYENGTRSAGPTSNVGGATYPNVTPFRIGAHSTGGENAAMLVAEIVVVKRDVTAIERAQMNSYFQDKYGIAVSDYQAQATTVSGPTILRWSGTSWERRKLLTRNSANTAWDWDVISTPAVSTYNPTKQWSYAGADSTSPFGFSTVQGTPPVVVNTPDAFFPKAGKFIADNNTRFAAAGDDATIRRTEVAHGDPAVIGTPQIGTRQHWGGTIWLPQNTVPQGANTTTGAWGILTQWHGSSGNPCLSIRLTTDSNPVSIELQFTLGPVHILGALQDIAISETIDGVAGWRVNWRMDILWHDVEANGRVSFWVNGVQKASNLARATLKAGNPASVYIKQGFYGSAQKTGGALNTPVTVYHTGLRWGPTEASITTAAGSSSTRDVTLHPYRGSWTAGATAGSYSVWNTPIGSGAQLVSATLGNMNAYSDGKVTQDPCWLGYATDPIKTLTTTDPRLPAGWSRQVRVPATATGPGTYTGGNNIAGFPDSVDPTRLWCGHPLSLTAGGNPTWRYQNPTQTSDDLYGPGDYGSHGGSHMSANACVKKAEWNAPEHDSIKHAIPVNIYGIYMSYTNIAAQQGGTGYRWPANSADSGAPTNYQGTNTAVKMGTLLTLPANFDWASIADAKAKKLLWNMWAFGWYVVDDSAWNVINFGMERGIETDSLSMTGFHNVIMSALMQSLVVNNNLPTSVGGGGTPRVPLVADVVRP